jgi:hypothetical protein
LRALVFAPLSTSLSTNDRNQIGAGKLTVLTSSSLTLANKDNDLKFFALKRVRSRKHSSKTSRGRIKHKNLIFHVILEIGPAPIDRIYNLVQQRISNLRNVVYPITYSQFRDQVRNLLRRGLVVRNGQAVQVADRSLAQEVLLKAHY